MTRYGAPPPEPPPESGTTTRTAPRTWLRYGAVLVAVIALLSASVTAVSYAWRHRTGGVEAVWASQPAPTAGASSPAAPPSSDPPRAITMSAVGDVIMGTAPAYLPPRAGAGYFDPVRKALAADLVMGNLEEPLTADVGWDKCGTAAPAKPSASGSPKPSAGTSASKTSGCYQFHLPPAYAGVLRSGGFSLMNLANNHTMDQGGTGLRNTRAALAGAGLRHTGAPGQITVYRTAGVSVAVIGVAPYAWCQSLLDIPATAALVRDASAKADLVVVQMQAGAEGADKTRVRPGMEIFLGEQRGDPYRFARAMIDAGADLIVGHGPHVMRGMEFYKGRLIAYSLGNFTGYRVLSSAGNSGVGGVLRVTLAPDGSWVSGSLVPTRMVNGGLPAPDPDRRAIALVGTLSAQDFGAAAAKIAPDGTITPTAG